ncbi:hypothetical protein BO82DRAFT_413940 [Aspergillus uvarum CBS 121591]|uniref:Uncharacterized protein n=1 Tax=Aspergillus uvarum CBS 121591 TaxID=1448315 RepID=A0A319C8Y1_9EURO|nr:hypothetical protein BO82DRAFT_413940 [Aspergillus uvarum CBS 121591]PYH82266.1 hypothetical protein BO82DRAFT_413940 [Aspergillus uvarum CBS 121591]
MRFITVRSTPLLALALATLLFLLQLTHALPVTTTELIPVHPENALARRGCIPSKPSKPTSPARTTTFTYSVDNIKEAINKVGRFDMDTNTCLFYLGLGGATGQKRALDWWKDNRPASASSQAGVVWGNLLADSYANAVWNANYDQKLPDPANRGQEVDAGLVWGGLVSQALGEACSGTVYFFTPESNDGTDPVTNVWNVYEHPALTRNAKVQQIIKVDPDTSSQVVIWTKGDAPYGPVPPGTGYSQMKTLDKALYPVLP